MTTNATGSFLRSDEQSWVSSNLFFMCLNKLKMNDKIYYLPSGATFTNDELTYYVDHLYDELMSVDLSSQPEKDAFDYARKVASVLRAWAKGGFSLKVV